LGTNVSAVAWWMRESLAFHCTEFEVASCSELTYSVECQPLDGRPSISFADRNTFQRAVRFD